MKSLPLVVLAFFVFSADASIIWTSSVNNCTCSEINSLFMGKFEVKGERCAPDGACFRPTSNNYMIIYFADGYRPPAGPQMGLALLHGRNAGYPVDRMNVTAGFDPICFNGKWYAQRFPFEIQYSRQDTNQQVWMDPTELNKKRLKHEIRSIMCGLG